MVGGLQVVTRDGPGFPETGESGNGLQGWQRGVNCPLHSPLRTKHPGSKRGHSQMRSGRRSGYFPQDTGSGAAAGPSLPSGPDKKKFVIAINMGKILFCQ